jgi:hypothetical protein
MNKKLPVMMQINPLKISLLAAVLALSACSPPQVVSRTSEDFTIVGVKPPKRLRIDVMDSNGVVYKGLYVSKHCSTWQQIKIGSKVNLDRLVMKGSNGETYVLPSIRTSDDVCPRS